MRPARSSGAISCWSSSAATRCAASAPGTPVIFDVKCSEVLPQALAKAGAKPVMWKTGHSLIKAKMKELDAPLAGEMSGHIFFGGDYFGFDDALFAAARLLEIVERTPFGLARLLADLPRTTATPEIRVDVSRGGEVRDRRARGRALRRAVSGQHHRRRPDHLSRAAGGCSAPPTPSRFWCMRFEATDPASAWTPTAAKSWSWLAGQGVRA